MLGMHSARILVTGFPLSKVTTSMSKTNPQKQMGFDWKNWMSMFYLAPCNKQRSHHQFLQAQTYRGDPDIGKKRGKLS